jgi:nicotinate-nucleotide--dimethylbenzimidazole phosphoribosyltransferase
LQQALDQKTKPLGSLGKLENLALQLGLQQGTLKPQIHQPLMIVFAGDHGIAQAGVSQYPREVTAQMVLNFLNGGAAINVLTRQLGWQLKVVDAGVAEELPRHSDLVPGKIGFGTRDFRDQPAMTADQLQSAWALGQVNVQTAESGNVVAFGEMGIGNTSAAAMLMHTMTDLPLNQCVGLGTGIDQDRLIHKQEQLGLAAKYHGRIEDPIMALQTYAGFEMVAMAGAMWQAAREGKTLVIDGFIATSVIAVLSKCDQAILDSCIFSHQSAERGHGDLLRWLGVSPLLHLDMRLGEGTGAALTLPLLQSACAILREMASFADAGVSDSHA